MSNERPPKSEVIIREWKRWNDMSRHTDILASTVFVRQHPSDDDLNEEKLSVSENQLLAGWLSFSSAQLAEQRSYWEWQA